MRIHDILLNVTDESAAPLVVTKFEMKHIKPIVIKAFVSSIHMYPIPRNS